MQKTPDQIFDEIEFRNAEISLARKRKLMGRIGDVLQLLGPVALIAFAGYWVKGILETPFIFAVWFVSSGFTALFKRWSLEDRIDALEQKLKKP